MSSFTLPLSFFMTLGILGWQMGFEKSEVGVFIVKKKSGCSWRKIFLTHWPGLIQWGLEEQPGHPASIESRMHHIFFQMYHQMYCFISFLSINCTVPQLNSELIHTIQTRFNWELAWVRLDIPLTPRLTQFQPPEDSINQIKDVGYERERKEVYTSVLPPQVFTPSSECSDSVFVNLLQICDGQKSVGLSQTSRTLRAEAQLERRRKLEICEVRSKVKKKLKEYEINSLGYYTLDNYQLEEGDVVIEFCEDRPVAAQEVTHAYTMYKTVDKKVKPVPGTVPDEIRVRRTIPRDPLQSLPSLPVHPPDFVPTARLTKERMDGLDVNKNEFLWPEEEKLMKYILCIHEATLPFEEKDRGTLSQEYFSDYIMPVIPHVPWEYKNIPIPPGIRDEVIDVLRSKIEAGVYEHSQSSYRCRWFCIKKKSGSLRVIHDLQPLNRVSIRDAGLLPKVDDFVEQNVGMVCCTMFDMFWGFDGRRLDVRSRDMTAFYTPLGLLRLTSLPMGYTNAPAEFQNCMTFILQDEIPKRAGVFIDDLPIKGPKTWYPDKDGKPEVLKENPGIRQSIWEHAQNVNIVMHKVRLAGATFSPKKTEVCRPEAIILGHKCSFEGRHPEDKRVDKILKWPAPENLTELRQFLGLCGTVRIWIKDYSRLARPLSQMLQKEEEYEWTQERQEAFETLKRMVSTAPALRPLDYQSDKPIIISVDTSYIAVGMVLSQIDENGKRRPARYGSIILKNQETRYSQPKLELYGLFRALREWRIYLIGAKKLQVEVDAKYIKGMLDQPDLMPNAPMNRWIQGILLFDFELIHVPATK